MDINTILETSKNIHFIGIGGSGMFPLVEILHSKGYKISGSDNNESDIVSRIRALKIPVALGHSPENVNDAQMVVYTAALLPNNPELIAAKKKGIPVFERAKLLGAVTKKFSECISVSGTHGKTTVTSMITQILIMAGKDPSAVIGGKLPLIDSYGRIGKTDLIVCEACEFADTFLNLSPSCAVVLNIDEDHLDYFKTMENLIFSFSKFSKLASKAVIYNGDDNNTLMAIREVDEKYKISFGIKSSNDWYAKNIALLNGAFPVFDIMYKNQKVGRVKLSVPGEHNVFNALAAIAASVYAGASVEQCIEGLESFRGAGRRFEILGEIAGITIADDYAHHPVELRSTLEATKKMHYKRVWAVFQPFTYSRTYSMLDEFAKVLKIADKVVMTEIMGSRETNTYGVYTSQLAEKIAGSVWFNSFEEIADYVVKNAQKGDLILTLGCGDIYKAAKLIKNRLKEKQL